MVGAGAGRGEGHRWEQGEESGDALVDVLPSALFDLLVRLFPSGFDGSELGLASGFGDVGALLLLWLWLRGRYSWSWRRRSSSRQSLSRPGRRGRR